MWKSFQLTNMNELQREIRKFKFSISFSEQKRDCGVWRVECNMVCWSGRTQCQEMQFLVLEKSENQAKTNTNLISPNFIVSVMAKRGKSDRKVLASSSVMNKNTQKPIQKWNQMHGRANPSRIASFKHFSLIWGRLKNLHHCGRGCRSRLSICQLNQIILKYWDGKAV